MKGPLASVSATGPVGEELEVAYDGKVTAVTFRNVPAFAIHLDAPIEVPTLGTVTVDVAYGGMIFAIAEARCTIALSSRGRDAWPLVPFAEMMNGRGTFSVVETPT